MPLQCLHRILISWVATTSIAASLRVGMLHYHIGISYFSAPLPSYRFKNLPLIRVRGYQNNSNYGPVLKADPSLKLKAHRLFHELMLPLTLECRTTGVPTLIWYHPTAVPCHPALLCAWHLFSQGLAFKVVASSISQQILIKMLPEVWNLLSHSHSFSSINAASHQLADFHWFDVESLTTPTPIDHSLLWTFVMQVKYTQYILFSGGRSRTAEHHAITQRAQTHDRLKTFSNFELSTYNIRTIVWDLNIIIQFTNIIRHYCVTIQADFLLSAAQLGLTHSKDWQFPAKWFKYTILRLYCISCTQIITISVHWITSEWDWYNNFNTECIHTVIITVSWTAMSERELILGFGSKLRYR